MRLRNDAVAASARDLGARLHRFRTSRSWSLERLAMASGLSRSYLSRLESGERQPGLAALVALAGAFRVPVGALFGETVPGERSVVRKADALQVTRDGLTLRVLSPPGLDRGLHALRITGKPGRKSTQLYDHLGEEWVHVLSGRLRITVGEHVDVLEPGDSAQFDARVPHRLDSEDNRAFELMLVAARPASILPTSHLRRVS